MKFDPDSIKKMAKDAAKVVAVTAGVGVGVIASGSDVVAQENQQGENPKPKIELDEGMPSNIPQGTEVLDSISGVEEGHPYAGIDFDAEYAKNSEAFDKRFSQKSREYPEFVPGQKSEFKGSLYKGEWSKLRVYNYNGDERDMEKFESMDSLEEKYPEHARALRGLALADYEKRKKKAAIESLIQEMRDAGLDTTYDHIPMDQGLAEMILKDVFRGVRGESTDGYDRPNTYMQELVRQSHPDVDPQLVFMRKHNANLRDYNMHFVYTAFRPLKTMAEEILSTNPDFSDEQVLERLKQDPSLADEDMKVVRQVLEALGE